MRHLRRVDVVPFAFLLLALQTPAPQQPAPIIVKIVETPHDPTGLSDVLLGALGLSGVLLLMALLAGVGVGVILYLTRSRRPLR